MQIGYYRKNVYGKTLFYIAEPENAAIMASILGTKTITEYEINQFSKLGVTFIETFAPNAK